MPLNTHRMWAIMEGKTLTLWSDTGGISSQTAFPESCTRVPGCRRGWGPVGPRCCTLTSEKTSGGELRTGGGRRGGPRCWLWRLLAFCVRRCAPAAPGRLRQDQFPTAPNPEVVFRVRTLPCPPGKERNRTLRFPVILFLQLSPPQLIFLYSFKARMFARARSLSGAQQGAEARGLLLIMFQSTGVVFF